MKRQQLLLLILAFGVFSILNTEMGIIGILPMAAEMYQVDIVQAGMLVSLFALGVAIAGPTMPLLSRGCAAGCGAHQHGRRGRHGRRRAHQQCLGSDV